MESVADKLRNLRERAQPKVTVRAMAELLDIPPSTYAFYESPKFKKPIIPFDLAKRIAKHLGERGVPTGEVMELAGLKSVDGASATADRTEYLEVQGSVAAGIWREQAYWPPDERYSIEVGPSPYPGAERFAVRNDGLSMNRTIPPGSDLECLRVAFGIIEPRPGDLVIVERTNHDLTELTCKRLDADEDGWLLRCESTEDEFQYSIPIGKPDRNNHTDEEVRVVGIVISAQQRHFRAR
jgi:SOS-response transcriptional repressor LexA